MRLGYHTGYWSAGPPPGAADAVLAADRLGLDSVWTAEAYGSDAFTPLAWWGARTSRVRLGTAVAQVAARTPTATAMAAAVGVREESWAIAVPRRRCSCWKLPPSPST